MTVLLTGFEPYGGYTVNPSAEVANALDGATIAGARTASHILPVVFSGMEDRLEALVDAESPDAVICLGLDPGEKAIKLEHIAANCMDFDIADNAGDVLQGPVSRHEAASLRSTLPLAEIESRIAANAIPVRSSDYAGRYLCNAVMYLVLADGARRTPTPACGFIHLPFLPEQRGVEASLSREQMIEAIRIAIATTLEYR